jgi:hypothetical protein
MQEAQMARPVKSGLDYFPHDTDASSDEKIEGLRALYDNDGYAFFFISLERIYRTPEMFLDISTPEAEKILAKKVGIRIDRFKNILKSALELGLFDKELFNNSKQLTSNGIRSRANIVLRHRANLRHNYDQKRGISSEETMEETMEENPPETLQKTGETKVKKTKQNINIKNKSEQKSSDAAINLSNKLKSLILRNNSKAKVPDDLNRWAVEIDRIMNLDERTETEIDEIITFSQEDKFWCANILSASKLREKYDQLYLKMKNGGHNNTDNQPDNVTARTKGYSTEEYQRSLRS